MAIQRKVAGVFASWNILCGQASHDVSKLFFKSEKLVLLSEANRGRSKDLGILPSEAGEGQTEFFAFGKLLSTDFCTLLLVSKR